MSRSSTTAFAIGQKLEMCSTGSSSRRTEGAAHERGHRHREPLQQLPERGLPPRSDREPRLVSLQAAADPRRQKYSTSVRTARTGPNTFTENYDDFLRAMQQAGE